MQIERQGFAVVDDADRDIGLSVGQICQLAGRQHFHLDVVVALLASDEGHWVTGQTIEASAGYKL